MTCQDSFHEVAFNISFWTRNISSARILFWRGVCLIHMAFPKSLRYINALDRFCFTVRAVNNWNLYFWFKFTKL